VGVELGEWLHLEEMKAGKLRGTIDRQLTDAIGEPQPVNTSEHFDMVILHPRDRVRISAASDRVAFRKAVLQLIGDVDRRWPTEKFWHSPQGCHIRDLAPWPPLGKYLTEVHFHPGNSKWAEGINWILPPAPGDSFDEQTMADPLLDLIRNKVTKYQQRPIATPSDELVLLVFLNQGVMHNSPIETPRRSVEMLVQDLRSQVADEQGQFQRAYLFIAPSPGERTFRLW
ncbi:MAG: hypothetical protein P4L40_03620, partial [Terracidiphilus sp.]|nr:hypothetical protein [Terracidiphilus sp.]